MLVQNYWLLLLISFISFFKYSSADLWITKPALHQNFTASGGNVDVDIVYEDDYKDPNISKLKTLTFILCTGENSDIEAVKTIKKGVSAPSDNKYSLSIPASAGASGVYFLQVIGVYSTGASIHYTRRFKLLGMSGSHKPSGNVQDLTPGSENNAGDNDPASMTATMQLSATATIPYTLQTGKVRVAPMQMQPGSTVTATAWSRQFPTSAVTYFTSASKPAFQLSTCTPGWSYTKTSAINYATALGNPSAWYAATKNIKKPTLSMAAASATSSSNKKRFWDLDWLLNAFFSEENIFIEKNAVQIL